MMLHLQWPALVLSMIGAWLIAGRSPRLRVVGFFLLLISSAFWAAWGTAAAAPAIVIAQLVFGYTSVRGIISNWSPQRRLARIEASGPNHRGGYQPIGPRPDPYPPAPPRGGSGKTA